MISVVLKFNDDHKVRFDLKYNLIKITSFDRAGAVINQIDHKMDFNIGIQKIMSTNTMSEAAFLINDGQFLVIKQSDLFDGFEILFKEKRKDYKEIGFYSQKQLFN